MSETTEVSIIETLNPVAVFTTGGMDDILRRIEKEVRAEEVDISTPAGRKKCASLAYKIARSKTAIDKAGKDLTDGWRQQTNAVNEDRRRAREFLDALGEDVRRPLTEYENREAARVQGHEDALAALVEPPSFYQMQQPSEGLATRLAWLRDQPDRDWQEFASRAERALASEIALTEQAMNRELAREHAEAEAARLAAEETARLQAEREAQIAAQAAEAARLEAEARAAAEAAAERAAVEKREREVREQALAAQAEAERREREAAEREARIQAQAEADRLAAARRERDAEERARRLEAVMDLRPTWQRS